MTSIKKIWKNKWLILEGVFNYYFTRKKIKRVAYWRNEICKDCPLYDVKGSKCEVSGTQPCCGDCGCSLKFKTYSMSSSCPQGRWHAIMTEEEEDEINTKLNLDQKLETIDDLVEELGDVYVDSKKMFEPSILKKIQEENNKNLEITNEFLDEPNLCDKSCFFKNTRLTDYYDNYYEAKIAEGSLYIESDYKGLIEHAAREIEKALKEDNVMVLKNYTRRIIKALYEYDKTLFSFWFEKYKPDINFSAYIVVIYTSENNKLVRDGNKKSTINFNFFNTGDNELFDEYGVKFTLTTDKVI